MPCRHGAVEALVQLGGEEGARAGAVLRAAAGGGGGGAAVEVPPMPATASTATAKAPPGRGREMPREQRAAAAVGERLEEAHLLVQVVADDVALPALARGLECVAWFTTAITTSVATPMAGWRS